MFLVILLHGMEPKPGSNQYVETVVMTLHSVKSSTTLSMNM